MRRRNKLALFSALCGILVTVFAFSPSKKKEKPKYQDHLNAAVAINKSFFGGNLGSGVILNTGYVITNRHVVDRNNNGKIDKREINVKVYTFGSTAEVYTGTVIASSGGTTRTNVLDVAIIKLENGPKSNISLISDDGYTAIPFGERLFAVGCTDGEDAHFTSGCRSFDLEEWFHRASVEVFYGNSGGGLYLDNSGELVGLTSRIRISRGAQVPSWSGYVPATKIREFLKNSGLLHVIGEKEDSGFKIVITTTLNVALFMFLAFLLVWKLTHALCGKRM